MHVCMCVCMCRFLSAETDLNVSRIANRRGLEDGQCKKVTVKLKDKKINRRLEAGRESG